MNPANGRSASRADVFCFPFAGGGASYYRAWAPKAPASITLRPVQLPGREERMGEAPFDRMPRLVEALADGLARDLDRSYALFGHSMGALVCYELAQELRRRGERLPAHLFVSGAPAPHLAPLVVPIYDLPGERFYAEIRRFGGLPDEVWRSEELLALLMPRFRADLAVTGTYAYTERPPLDCPITAFGGEEDETVSLASIEGWREHTVKAFRRELFPGGHFFLNEFGPRILAVIGDELSS
ncbi:MAG TPA: alpha/beta fold hydrolase [Thermoanaerobaculia bacterium]|nr:alpha/beta fold hydrolase [Thermoanaerobaculia bacterium]